MSKVHSKISDENRIGKIRSSTFDNGFRVYVREKRDAPLVSVQAWVKTGSIHEGKYLGCGLSHFLEHMMFKGTKKYPGQSIAETIHNSGGEINAYTSYGATVYHIDVNSEFGGMAMDILSDILINPLFPEDKFMDEKNVILRERDMYLDNPGRFISEKLNLEMFRVHPIRHPIIGYREKIESVNREIMEEYYKKRYLPGRSFFVISGDIDADMAIEELREKFGKQPIGDLNEQFIPEEPEQTCHVSSEYTFKDPLARLAIGFHSPCASGPDVPALDIIASIMGQNKSSRLIRKLKDEKHLAININSFNYTPYFCGLFAVNATCSPDKARELEDSIYSEFEKLKEDGISEKELEKELTMQTTDYIRNLRCNNAMARLIGNTVLSYGSPNYADKYLEDMAKVTPEDILEAANRYFSKDSSSVVRLLPEESAGKQKSVKNKSSVEKKPDMEKLPGGQRIIVFKENSLPLADICIALPGGVIFENENNAGISRLASAMLSAGTKKYSEKELSELLDANAIELSISGGNNSVVLKANCRKDKFSLTVSILKSILTESLFPQKEFSREQHNVIESLKSRRCNPQNAAEDRMCEMLYGKHPYSHPSAGNEKSVASLSAKDVKDFYMKTCLFPEMSVFGIAGDIEAKEAVAEIKSLIDCIPWNTASKPGMPSKPVFPAKPITEKYKLPREQSVIIKGFPACNILSDDRFASDIVQAAVNGMASKLFKSVRENEGLAYYTGLYSSRGFHEGFLAFYAGTHPDTVNEVDKLLDKERKRLARKGLSEAEFNAAKASLYFGISEQMQNPSLLIFNSVLSEFYGNGYLMPWQNKDIYKNISLQPFNRILGKYMDSSSVITVIAGP
ncbi:MAG: hypothetical protein A2017_08540 [Lentisphaerae bacterium GWF2_44_16]|nr:MAG: hypothetical protein A2017_08540 [Lentisphaerae bacterium GWF2_44_16]